MPYPPAPILPNNRHPHQANPDRASSEHAMSADPVGGPVRHAHQDVPRKLAVIDHRLHQISTQLYTMSKLLSQLDEIRSNLETLTGSLRSGGSIVNGRVPRRDRAVSPRQGADHPGSPRRATGWPSVERVPPDTQLPAASRSPTRRRDALGGEAADHDDHHNGPHLSTNHRAGVGERPRPPTLTPSSTPPAVRRAG
ncbi:MAG: hypothetical protein JO345_15610 [Streptosporangiaceae bacterium]|nr:hypothetical protein [Streptosporangiaceae bacterium]